MKMEFCQKTDRGRVRDKNEDFMGTGLPASDEEAARKGTLFVIADGLGGMAQGEVASRQAVQTVTQAWKKAGTIKGPQWLREAFKKANEKIYAWNHERILPDRMATTLTASLFLKNTLHIAHVGDCRAYQIREGKIRCLTRDHSESRHVLTRVIGADPELEVDLYEIQPRAGDFYLHCSDGLYTLMEASELLDLIPQNPFQKVPSLLVDLAHDRGGPDNITLQLIAVV